MQNPLIRALPAAFLLAALPVVSLADAAAPTPPTIVGDGVNTPKLELRHWGSPKLLRNPVALWVNDQGVVYTAETERAGNGRAVLDTRFTGHIPNNILIDIGLLSVDDRIAQEKDWEAKGYYPKGRFTATADYVRAIRDTNGDGVADSSQVLATFQEHGDGINSGVMELDGNVYATCIPHLWKIAAQPGPDGKFAKESLSYGWGVRLAFYGHDMHGLTQGPDGRIYFSIGDRGFNVVTREGVHYDMVGAGHPWDEKMDAKHVQGYCRGGVFRCWPDGSGMELVFEGVRNPQGLAFNNLGQLFTGDNNSDIGGDPARFDHLPEYGDGGWRQDVQTFDKPLPQGAGTNDGTAFWRGPWLREKMPWVRDGKGAPADPHDPTTPAWQIPPMMNLGNGPSGMTHMPGTGHQAQYDDNLLMVNYLPQLYAVKATPQGAWYKGEAREYFRTDRMTDIKWGPDGQLFVSQFGATWSPGDKGEVLALRDPKVFADANEKAAIDEVKRLLGQGMAKRKENELLALLGHRDQRVRQRAQNELAKRSGDEAQLLDQSKNTAQAQLARVHAIWALWQKAGWNQAHGQKATFDPAALEPLAQDKDAVIRTQAVRVLGDLRHPSSQTYLAALKDGSPPVRFYAALAVGKTADKAAIPALFGVLKDAANTDPVLRHGASWALAQIAFGSDGALLAQAAQGAGADERIGLVIALRHLRSPLLAQYLQDPNAQVATEAARAIYDMEVRAAYPALADMLGHLKPELKNEAFMRRAIEAAATLGRPQDAHALAAAVSDEGVQLPHKKFALECLFNWDKPVLRERVWGHVVNRKGHDAKVVQDEVEKSASAILAASARHKELADWTGKLLGRQLPKMTADEMAAKACDTSYDNAYRGAMLERLAREAKGRVPEVAMKLLADAKDADLRIRTRELLAQTAPVEGCKHWLKTLENGTLDERQAALRGLAGLGLPVAQDEIAWLWHRFQIGALDPSLGLDMVAAAETCANADIQAQAKAYRRANLTTLGMEDTQVVKPNPLLLVGGNAIRGEGYFRDPPGGKSCTECHNAGGPEWNGFDPNHQPDGKGGGYPNLDNVAQVAAHHDPLYLPRAILDPGADIAEGFLAPSAMYEKYAHDLSAEQVRDLVAYLQTLKGAPAVVAKEAPHHTGHTQTSNPATRVFAVMFGLVFMLLAVTGVLTLLTERNKPKLS